MANAAVAGFRGKGRELGSEALGLEIDPPAAIERGFKPGWTSSESAIEAVEVRPLVQH